VFVGVGVGAGVVVGACKHVVCAYVHIINIYFVSAIMEILSGQGVWVWV